MAGEGEQLVGYLEVRFKGNGSNGERHLIECDMVLIQLGTPDLIEIRGNNQFYLGRNASLWSEQTCQVS
jgi:hypothetical protein